MDMTVWLEYFVEGLASQMQEVTRRGRQVISLDVLARDRSLSERQSSLLGFLLEHGELAIQDFERLCPEANRRTLQRDLKTLIGKQLVAERASSPTDPTNRYILAPGIL